MRYGFISDIHSNLEALETVLKHILSKGGVDRYYCCGDVVGYGPEPNRCLDIVHEKCKSIVMGNHDHGVLDARALAYFNSYARDACIWTREVLTQENLDVLKQLTLRCKLDEVSEMVHASPSSPTEEYMLNLYQAEINFHFLTSSICFIGHTHIPMYYVKQNDTVDLGYFEPERPMMLNKNAYYFINVGSVGQPRDGDPRSAYGIFDTDELSFTLYRVPYDIKKTQDKMREVNLPDYLIDRIERGR